MPLSDTLRFHLRGLTSRHQRYLALFLTINQTVVWIIRLRGYYQFYPLVRIKSIWKHILSALRDKRCDIRDRG
ncbi:hypothetical protein EIG49_03320 [Escherichia coli O2:H14]|nr:hypothetical protein [Escherichia coli O2:H14]EFN7317968.1 hypothetical protein [Escherichia coli O2:H14]